MSKYLVVDTETGGIDHSKHSLLSMAAAVWEPGKNYDSVKQLSEIKESIELNIVNDEYVVTAAALSINGIDLSTHTGESRQEVARRLKLFIKRISNDKLPTLVGWNVDFDSNFLGKSLYGNVAGHRSVPWSYRYLDLCPVAMWLKQCGLFKVEKVSSGVLFDHFGIHRPEPHTAGTDVLATVKLAEKLYELQLSVM